MELVLTRQYFPEGTNGVIYNNGKLICKTIELPWRYNARRISCIPEGKYFLKKRHSRKYGWHLEVLDVRNRSTILFHPANNAKTELNGCIAPVSKISGAGRGLMSKKAFLKLRDMAFQALEQQTKVILIIKS